MSLCRFYPAPSDRMAIIWSLMPVKNAVVLEYGPAGTTHFGGGLYSSFGIELGKTLYTTHISEDDVIMGDVSRLENAIREVDAAYNPEIISWWLLRLLQLSAQTLPACVGICRMR